MITVKRFSVLVIIILIFSKCEKPPDYKAVPIYPPYAPPYAALEKKVRGMYDFRAVFTWSQYIDLLLKLSSGKFIVLPLEEMRTTFDDSKVVVGFRHDIDWNPFKAIEMSKIEMEFGIRATYFILPTSYYYGILDRSGLTRNTCMDSVYIELAENGAEIGIHNDLLTVMIEDGIDPFTFNQNDLIYFRSLHIPVRGTASHGSPLAKVTVPNFQIFSDFAKSDTVIYHGVPYPLGQHSLKDYGFDYEAYFINFNKYYSESAGMWNNPVGFNGILDQLEKSVPGDRIEILTHPEWWGKKIN